MQANFYTDVGYFQLIIPRFIQGIGIAFFFTPLIAIVLAGLPPERMASALGLSNFFRILGGSFGTSMSVTLWDRREAFHHSNLVANVNDFNPISTQFIAQLHSLGFTGLSAFEKTVVIITNQAYMLATNDIFWLSGWIFLGLLVVIWFAKPPFLGKGKVVAAE